MNLLTTLIAFHCTALTNYQHAGVYCLVNNQWAEKGALTKDDGPCSDTEAKSYSSLNAVTSDDHKELHVFLEKCYNGPNKQFEVKRWSDSSKLWEDEGVIIRDETPDYPYAQYGITGTFVGFFQNPLRTVVNNYQSTTYHWREGEEWQRIRVLDELPRNPLDSTVRHPAVYSFPETKQAFILYGEPFVSLWNAEESDVHAFEPAIPTPDLALFYPLYTDMTLWQGKPVVSYSYTDYPQVQNWLQSKARTRVIYFNGTTWDTLTDSIQDTYGHDGERSHVFVKDGALHIMYFDYSSTGRPTNSQVVRGRFRVKRYDPATLKWTRVGNESPIFMLSQRFEFFDENGTVYFNSIVRSLPLYIHQAWKWDGNFVKFGPNLMVSAEDYPRPGTMVNYAP